MLLQSIRLSGLGALFTSHDARRDASRGLWPGPALRQDDKLLRATEQLRAMLVSEAYGGVVAARHARDAYNERRGLVET